MIFLSSVEFFPTLLYIHPAEKAVEKNLKKFEKISKNLLTTEERCDIITKLSRKRAAKRSLKIEQRREKYKHKVCARTELENF